MTIAYHIVAVAGRCRLVPLRVHHEGLLLRGGLAHRGVAAVWAYARVPGGLCRGLADVGS